MALSKTCQTLLAYAKTSAPSFTSKALADVLCPLYYPGMTLVDIVSVTLSAYNELLAEPRFEVANGEVSSHRLLLSPIKGASSIELMGPASFDTTYTVTQFYDAMLADMLQQMRVASVLWMKANGAGTGDTPSEPKPSITFQHYDAFTAAVKQVGQERAALALALQQESKSPSSD